MFGSTAAGWLRGIAGLAAHRALGGGDDPFLRTKLQTVRFYADHVLPQARGLLSSTTAGAAGMMDIEVDQLGR